jgi:DNA-binding protein HU-beta
MAERMEKKTLMSLVARRTGADEALVEQVVEATFETVFEALKRGESVSLRDFGTFYVRPEPGSWVFKFNPSQRLRKLFGWASTYKGEV